MTVINNASIAAIAIILVTSLVILFKWKHANLMTPMHSTRSVKTNKEPTIVIAGSSNSGKTSLFNLLVSNEAHSTLMSQVPNIKSNFKLPFGSQSTKFTLMDFPGHTKLRHMLYQALKESTNIKFIILMVDSTSDPKNITDTAEILYEILKITERNPLGVDILIACNKSESFTSRLPVKFRIALEQEIDTIIKTKKKNLSSLNHNLSAGVEEEEEDDDDILPIHASNGFSFNLLEGSVDAIEGSVLKNDIGKWGNWIEERTS
ncbi:HHL035Wp [Eremothecium sinecaudum]|uniref:Signal recognition particle receptor subunit beta n=1 Tax=Eremothecium sinecaudum TaxID=45286 RepID=A0A0X8HWG1_9SACH|nr:HHL035Wp [Eremothecium sinecaudum]AMD22735.1 HHL035Wp [Eremothecium sinecaudum]